MGHKGARLQGLTIQALECIASDQELVEELLAMTGLRAQDLRQAARDPGFGSGLLDFLLEDDQRVLRFADFAGIRPQELLAARTILAGPGSHGWTAD